MVIVVDIRPVLDEYAKYPSLYSLYEKYPLKDMVTSILSASMHSMQNGLWDELDVRFKEESDPLIYEHVDIFFESLTWAIDDYIGKRVPDYYESGNYLLDRWVDGTSVALTEPT